MKIMEIIEFNARIKKIMKIIQFQKDNNEKHENPIIPIENHEIIEILEFHERIWKIMIVLKSH